MKKIISNKSLIIGLLIVEGLIVSFVLFLFIRFGYSELISRKLWIPICLLCLLIIWVGYHLIREILEPTVIESDAITASFYLERKNKFLYIFGFRYKHEYFRITFSEIKDLIEGEMESKDEYFPTILLKLTNEKSYHFRSYLYSAKISKQIIDTIKHEINYN